MKPDEIQFLRIMFERCTYHTKDGVVHRESPREIINSPGFPLHHKRAWYLLSKWSKWYDFGVTQDLGWLTVEGMEAIGDLLLDKAKSELPALMEKIKENVEREINDPNPPADRPLNFGLPVKEDNYESCSLTNIPYYKPFRILDLFGKSPMPPVSLESPAAQTSTPSTPTPDNTH